MRLYVYDHCPFCVRAEMVGFYKKVPMERVVLLNDDVETPMRLIGNKQVPILEFDNGTAMGESLDIVKIFDEIGDKSQIMRPVTPVSRDIINHINMVSDAINNLLFPRIVKIGLPEFATKSAIAYFTEKKEKMLHKSFDKALSETAIHKEAVEEMLDSFELFPVIVDDTINHQDVLIFPTLRSLTMVENLKIPKKIKETIEEYSRLTGVSLYYDRAI